MKIIIRIAQALVIVAVASSFAHADEFMYFKKKAAAGGGGSVLKDDNSGVTSTSAFEVGTGYYGHLKIRAVYYTAGSTYTLTSIKYPTIRSGTGGNCDMTLLIYAADGTTLLGTSNSINSSALPTTGSQEWTFSGVSISSGSDYAIVLNPSSSACATIGNAPTLNYNNTGSVLVQSWGDTWDTEVDYTANVWYQTYGY